LARGREIESGEESGESEINENYDSASYSDDVSGVWSMGEDNDIADEEANVAAATEEETKGKRIAVK